MKKRNLKAIITATALAACATLQPLAATARPDGSPQEAGGGTVSLANQSGRVSVKLERGSKVAISNRYGRIIITGWDRDTVEAAATNAKGAAEAIQVEMTADPQARSALALAVVGRGRGSGNFVYAPSMPRPKPNPAPEPKINQEMKERIKEAARSGVILVPMPDVVVETPGVVVTVPQAPQAPQPAQATPRPPTAPRAGGIYAPAMPGRMGEDNGITLDVKVPRYAQLDTIEVRAGDLNVSGIDGPVSVMSGSGDVTVSRVGSLEVRSRGGSINVEDVDGLIYIVASSGEIKVRRSKGDVRATTINGDIDIGCVKGRVDASNARGAIVLNNIGGDVEATTTDADINFTGAIAQNGRYRLKSMEGRVLMAVPESSPGFTANLMSYNSEATTEFPVRTSTPRPVAQASRRLEARHGDGQAQITLDSFSQAVRLKKLAPGATTACK